MYTYEVWIRDNSYQGKTPLTYTSTERLLPGVVVRVPLKKKLVLGIVKRLAPAPKGVAMKPIEDIITTNDHPLPTELLKLMIWLNAYYPAGSGSITQLFLPAVWPKKSRETVKTHNKNKTYNLPALTKEQNKVLKELRGYHGTAILHGDTGTGKTRVYTELIRTALARGQSALILTPEIGLTPQLLNDLQIAFPKQHLTVVHSGLTIAERRYAWLKILQTNQPQIVIGPRSALFVPLQNIGCIIVDECHDDSYKQDNAPYYHALRVASQLAIFHEALCIFGSATPNVSDVYIAKKKNVPIIRMTTQAKKSKILNNKPVVVSRREKAEFTRSKHLSNSLLKAIEEQLIQQQQSLLFLNRRGSARIIACSNCGWRAVCPDCSLPITMHEDAFELRCHTCGYKQKAPISCPECNNIDIIYLGPGTKTLEKELNHFFPEARIARFDSDNLTHERLDKQIQHIKDGSIDIIIGTQILVKGFDMPKLSLVCVVDADSSLSFPDFTTEEKTYQLINQAIGRVGRGHVTGNTVVQTVDPTSKLLKQALSKDWNTFYQDQITDRKKHNFPPFTFLLKLECKRKSHASVIQAAQRLKSSIVTQFPDVTVLGPTPSFYEKQSGYFVWQLVIKSPHRSQLVAIISQLPNGWKYNIDPTHLL